jgi:hypothetical protein
MKTLSDFSLWCRTIVVIFLRKLPTSIAIVVDVDCPFCNSKTYGWSISSRVPLPYNLHHIISTLRNAPHYTDCFSIQDCHGCWRFIIKQKTKIATRFFVVARCRFNQTVKRSPHLNSVDCTKVPTRTSALGWACFSLGLLG